MATTPQRSRPIQPARSRATGTSGRQGLRALARAGLIARGVVYGVIGVLSLKLALGSGGKTESQTGAFQTIANQSFGEVLLIALAIGLAGYAIWRLIEGIAGTRPGDDGGAERRVSAVGSGVAYAVLCYAAVEIIAGAHKSGGGSPRHAAAGILGWPGGPVIVGIVGLVVIGIGGYQAYKGLAQKFLEDSYTGQMSPQGRKAFTAVGVIGHVARAVTFVLVGYGLIRAALNYSAKSAIGLDGALQKLAHAPEGPLLLGIVAVGFIAFALYSIADSRYHKL